MFTRVLYMDYICMRRLVVERRLVAERRGGTCKFRKRNAKNMLI